MLLLYITYFLLHSLFFRYISYYLNILLLHLYLPCLFPIVHNYMGIYLVVLQILLFGNHLLFLFFQFLLRIFLYKSPHIYICFWLVLLFVLIFLFFLCLFHHNHCYHMNMVRYNLY